MREVFMQIIQHFGAVNQLHKAVEELLELAEVLEKDANKRTWSRAKVIEELADVLVMAEQLKIIYDIPDEAIIEMKNQKINRTLRRMRE